MLLSERNQTAAVPVHAFAANWQNRDVRRRATALPSLRADGDKKEMAAMRERTTIERSFSGFLAFGVLGFAAVTTPHPRLGTPGPEPHQPATRPFITPTA